ncbi:shieldin complex subunit 1-like isoform X2 [Stegostoma tigrinum]|nr:shieldin complex subunit 1-like isoform X2 [Stegostoma tigrinum]XP_059504326.1 shieldin complex subunit 1-like isoform X2 [Stegostoma tigrinum]XP_059504327.1 shieldin complex subunit 1-like isoform X2 [Stegostoma tigrinum]XP_059504328.1 shieldin complex subunit 1-like isoform X2 [Stegostoma tigrinum]XP_059504329.1 shieldin complex subunit 1-like isoform X2 [Stegostoma tigrinum]
MSTNEVLSSNLSESNSVLELPSTYSLPNISEQLMFEDIVRKHSDSVVITSASATPITNIDSNHSNSEDCNSTIGIAELHPKVEGEPGHINVAQTVEDFYNDAGERKLVELDPVSERIAHLLTSKISQLKEERGGQYLLRSFQMALVLFTRHGADIFPIGNCKGGHFSSVNSAFNSLEFSCLPGLSKDVVSFILQEFQNEQIQ